MSYRQIVRNSESRAKTVPFSDAHRIENPEEKGRLLAFIERHQTMVQLIPLFLAIALMLLSNFSDDLAGGMSMLSVTGLR